jgi:hypothetical protein
MKNEESENIDLGFVVREVDLRNPVPALRRYLDLIEAQMEEVHRCERVALDAERPTGDEDEFHVFCQKQDALERLFDEDLVPTMRYSFLVLLHIAFETRLRLFCSTIHKERMLRVTLGDLKGGAIERARTYLTKLAQLPVADFAEWQQLRTLQKLRDCIVHRYGYVADSRDASEIRNLACKETGFTIDTDDRLMLTKALCDRYLLCLDMFFRKLSISLGWTTQWIQ